MAGLIDQIEVGGGSTPFTYIDYIEVDGQQYKNNFSGITVTNTGSNIYLPVKIKMKSSARFVNMSNKDDNSLKNKSFSSDSWDSGQEYTFDLNKQAITKGFPLVFSKPHEWNKNYEPPDFFFFLYNYQGE